MVDGQSKPNVVCGWLHSCVALPFPACRVTGGCGVERQGLKLNLCCWTYNPALHLPVRDSSSESGPRQGPLPSGSSGLFVFLSGFRYV
jgi:hypothetical protein